MAFPRVLVLGASGRIGGILRRVWTGPGVVWQARGGAGGPGWALFDPLGDDRALVRAAEGCDVILCLAGVTPARAARGADMGDNVALALATIRAAAQTGARVLLTSSAAVYGNQGGLLVESALLEPVSPYGRAKAEMERQGARLAAQTGVPICALRIGNIAGLDAILGGWRPGFQLDRFPDGRTPRRSYIGVETLARVLGDLAAAPDLPGVLNVAAPGAIEMGALLEAAGLGWTARPAPATAIAEVRLGVQALERLTDLTRAEGLPATLVTQWRKLTETR